MKMGAPSLVCWEIVKLAVPCNRIYMRPDYIHKIFDDKRLCYFLLMEALAMDASLASL